MYEKSPLGAMAILRVINKITKVVDKFMMAAIAIIISALLFTNVDDRIITVLWTAFIILSFFFSLNGFLLIMDFKSEVKDYEKAGKPIRGIQGFNELEESMKKSALQSYLVTFTSALAFGLYLISSNTISISALEPLNSLGHTLSVTMILVAVSVMFLVEYPDDPSFTPGGLIGYYEPDAFPLVLDNLLTDVFTTYIDPATFLKIDEWSNNILANLVPSFEADENAPTRLERAREKVLLLAYLGHSNPTGFPHEVIERELTELFADKTPQFVNGDNSGLTWKEIQDIIQRIEKRAPEPFRLVDRIMVQLVDNYTKFTSDDMYFTVSVKPNQGSVTESSGVLAYFINLTQKEDRSVTIKLETDPNSIHPSRQEITIALDKMTDPLPLEQPPMTGEGVDTLALLSSLLQVGDAVWFRLQPSGFGYRVISVKATENSTNRGFGKTFEIRFTKSISWYIKAFAPKLSALGGVALPLIKSALSLGA